MKSAFLGFFDVKPYKPTTYVFSGAIGRKVIKTNDFFLSSFVAANV
jgi:hypothetical protein